MKKVILIAGIASLVLGACSTSKLATTNDDVYANPAEEKRENERLAAEKKKAKEEADRKKAEEVAAQKAKDDADPKYKSPDYNKDDYYDYEYAARLKRFGGYNGGIGYYDNWYTNSYYYNNNPNMYGVSIYSSYNYWGNSNYSYGGYHPYNNYSSGYMNGYYNGYNNGYMNGMYGYNPYGGYGYNPYGGYGYNPYGGYNPYAYGGYGYNPYYGYGNGWGYFNQFDVNSGYKKATYGPRGSADGGNGLRMSNPGKSADSYAAKYIQEVNSAQEVAPKFNEVRHVNNSKSNISAYDNNSGISAPNTGRPINGNDASDNNSPVIGRPNTNNSSDNDGFNTYHHPKATELNPNINNNQNNQPVKNTPKNNDVLDSKPFEIIPRQNPNPKKDLYEMDNAPKFNNSQDKSFQQSNPQPVNSSPRNNGNSGGNGGGRPR